MPRMRLRWIFFLLLLAGCAVAWFWTGAAAGSSFTTNKPNSSLTPAERTLAIPRSLYGMADTPEEQQLDTQAAKLADQSMDLGYQQQLQAAAGQPQAKGPEWQRLKAAESAIAATQNQLAALRASLAKAKPAQLAAMQARQQLLQAHLGLLQAKLADARQDLLRSQISGAPAINRAHEAAHAAVEQISAPWRNRFQTQSAERNPDTAAGLAALVRCWQLLGQKQKALAFVENWEGQEAARMLRLHNQLEARLNAEGRQRTQAMQMAGALLTADGSSASASLHTALQLQERAALLQRRMSEYDQRYQIQQQLAGIYQHWEAIAVAQRYYALHRIFGDLLYLLIGLGVLGFSAGLLTASLHHRRAEARRMRTLRHLLRLTVYAAGVLWALMLIFGRPTQLVAILGLAGAGLTVALQDMILSLCGWFVLIGRHGVSPGDWVEIDDVVGQVVGEVVEVGLLRTVLLETGNWTEAGHPTGRRVYFPNSYVFQGHYFNFTTSGQWLWDELQVQLPAGWDEQKLVATVTERVRRETENEARAAEAEWRKQTHLHADSGLSFSPTAQIKPTATGINLSIRYITTSALRSQMRSRLYRHIYQLFGGEAAVTGRNAGPGASSEATSTT